MFAPAHRRTARDLRLGPLVAVAWLAWTWGRVGHVCAGVIRVHDLDDGDLRDLTFMFQEADVCMTSCKEKTDRIDN